MQSMPYYPQQQQGYQSPYQNSPTNNVLNSAPIMGHPNGLPPMQHLTDPQQQQQQQVVAVAGQQAPKRKQVKNACTNCQKACKKCDDARPCPRCIKYGIADTCVNSVRKERKKGIKRGPYKRRQKTGEEKPRKAQLTETANEPTYSTPATATAATAMRGPAMPFGYPSNLNQYGQPYDPYSQYGAPQHYKAEMMGQSYVVNPVYPPLGYPVLVPGGQQQQQQSNQQASNTNETNSQQQHGNYSQHSNPVSQQHYNAMMQHQQQQQSNNSPSQQGRPLMHSDHLQSSSPAGSPQVYYQQQHSQPPSQRNSPHLPEIKHESAPVPSTSTSTATTSSPDSGSWVPPRSS